MMNRRFQIAAGLSALTVGAGASRAAQHAYRKRLEQGAAPSKALSVASAPARAFSRVAGGLRKRSGGSPDVLEQAAAGAGIRERLERRAGALSEEIAQLARAPVSAERDRTLVDLYGQLGNALSDLDEHRATELAFGQMAKLAQRRGLTSSHEIALLNLADHLTYTDRFEAGVPLAGSALASALRRRDPDHLSYAHGTLARIELCRREPQRAVAHLDTALGLVKNQPDYWNRADLHTDHARALLAVGQPEKALAQAKLALKAADPLEARVHTSALVTQAEVLASLGRRTEARDCAKQVLARTTEIADAETIRRAEELARG